MKTAAIKSALLNGNQFQNDAANWYSLCKPADNRFILVINEETKIYKNIDSISRRIYQLLKRGY